MNNVEQITVAAPVAGVYELRVRGFRVPQGPQVFSIAYEFGEADFGWQYPVASSALRSAAGQGLRWQWAGPATTARLEYRPVGRTAWQVISAAVDLSAGYFAWSPPDTATLAQLRFVTPTAIYPTETFAIHPPLHLQVGYACAEDALLYWSPVPGATKYQLYRLGATGLEPWRRTADTVAVLTQRERATRYYAVVPVLVLGGKIGALSASIDQTEPGTGCYVCSFVPRQAVTDIVLFDLEIGTTYGLIALALERQTPTGSYEIVQTVTPVRSVRLALADPTPTTGLNRYRVRLSTAGGQIVYSQTEDVQYARAAELLAFPNPVRADEPLQLITGTSGSIHIRLYDLLGRLVRETTAKGASNPLDTSGLRSGTCLVRVQPESGPAVTRRIVMVLILLPDYSAQRNQP